MYRGKTSVCQCLVCVFVLFPTWKIELFVCQVNKSEIPSLWTGTHVKCHKWHFLSWNGIAHCCRSSNRRVENFTATMLAYLGNFEDLNLLHSTHTIMKLSISHSHQKSYFSTFCLPKEFPIRNNVNTFFYSWIG